jgi:hypothetical protein
LGSRRSDLSELIKVCLETEEIDEKLELVYAINDLIVGLRIKLHTRVTNKYIDQQLYSLEEKLSSTVL